MTYDKLKATDDVLIQRGTNSYKTDLDTLKTEIGGGSSSVPTATDTVEGAVVLSDAADSSLNAATGGTAATPNAVKQAYDLANQKLSDSQGDLRYLTLSGSPQTATSPKTFQNGIRVDATLQCGYLGADANYLNIYLEDLGSGYRKTISAVGNGPIRIMDSAEFSSIYIRNSGGSQGNFWFTGGTNGPTAVCMLVNPSFTASGPDSAANVTAVDCIQVKPSWASTTSNLNYIAHIDLVGDKDGTGSTSGKRTQYTYGIRVPSWNGGDAGGAGYAGASKGFYSEASQKGYFHIENASTRAMSSAGQVLFNGIRVASSARTVSCDDDGWLTKATTFRALWKTNREVTDTELKTFGLPTTLIPRFITWNNTEHNAELAEIMYRGEEFGIKRSHKHHSLDWGSFRLDPQEVADFHPRLCCYDWPQKTWVRREPGTESEDDPGLTEQINDYDQEPIPAEVDYNGITTLLVGIVKKHTAEIQELKNEIAALKADPSTATNLERFGF